MTERHCEARAGGKGFSFFWCTVLRGDWFAGRPGYVHLSSLYGALIGHASAILLTTSELYVPVLATPSPLNLKFLPYSLLFLSQ